MQHRSLREPLTRSMLVLLVGLIVAGTALFVTGVVIEHSGSSTTVGQSRTSNALQDSDGGHETPVPEQVNQGKPGETVFGLGLENPWFVAAFALLWVVFGAALVRFGRIVLPAILLVALGATVLDVGEVVRQGGEANGLLVSLSGLVTVSHVALAILACVILILGRRFNWTRLDDSRGRQ